MHYKIYIFIFLTFTLLVSCSTNVNKSYDKEISIAEKKEILVQKKILINEMAKASIKLHKITWPILLANKQKCKDNRKKSYGSLFADVNDLPEEDKKLLNDEDVREFYLGLNAEGTKRKSFKEVKHYKRKKRWLS